MAFQVVATNYLNYIITPALIYRNLIVSKIIIWWSHFLYY